MLVVYNTSGFYLIRGTHDTTAASHITMAIVINAAFFTRSCDGALGPELSAPCTRLYDTDTPQTSLYYYYKITRCSISKIYSFLTSSLKVEYFDDDIINSDTQPYQYVK